MPQERIPNPAQQPREVHEVFGALGCHCRRARPWPAAKAARRPPESASAAGGVACQKMPGGAGSSPEAGTNGPAEASDQASAANDNAPKRRTTMPRRTQARFLARHPGRYPNRSTGHPARPARKYPSRSTRCRASLPRRCQDRPPDWKLTLRRNPPRSSSPSRPTRCHRPEGRKCRSVRSPRYPSRAGPRCSIRHLKRCLITPLKPTRTPRSPDPARPPWRTIQALGPETERTYRTTSRTFLGSPTQAVP